MTTLSAEVQQTKDKLEEITQSFDGWTAIPEHQDSDEIKAFSYRDTIEITRYWFKDSGKAVYTLRGFWSRVPVPYAPSSILEGFFQRLEELALDKTRSDFLALTK